MLYNSGWIIFEMYFHLTSSVCIPFQHRTGFSLTWPYASVELWYLLVIGTVPKKRCVLKLSRCVWNEVSLCALGNVFTALIV